jgi:hypothetical protein
MELDELKKMWNQTPIQNKPIINIMELIQHKSYGPLASLKRTYRKQIRVMAVLPLLLMLINLNDIDKVLTSILFWSYVVFCIAIVLFARYNYRIVKSMQTMDTVVKVNLEQQIALLEKRANMEIWGLRAVLLFFVLLLEIVPYLQHYRMLDKWHSLSPFIRFAAYNGLLLLQYVLNKRLKERKVGRHLRYLKELVGQMQ